MNYKPAYNLYWPAERGPYRIIRVNRKIIQLYWRFFEVTLRPWRLTHRPIRSHLGDILGPFRGISMPNGGCFEAVLGLFRGQIEVASAGHNKFYNYIKSDHWSDWIKPVHIGSEWISFDQIASEWIRIDQIGLDKITSDLIRINWIIPVQIWSNWIRWFNWIRLDQIRLD